MMKPLHNRIEVIYCDDVREEIGSKFSYMGVYGADLVIPKFPVVLPKLCLVVKVILDIEKPLHDLEVIVLQGDEEREILGTGQIQFPPKESIQTEGSNFIVFQTFLILSPFQIDGETILRVHAKTGSEILKGVALRIKSAPSLNA